MDEALQFIIEMHESIWGGFKNDLKDVTPEEVNWRPLPQANTINLILRHLRLEGSWHLGRIKDGAQTAEQPALPLDFEANLKELEELFTGFIAALRGSTLAELRQQTARAYQDSPRSAHAIAFHQVLHLAMHWGQIRTIRNLYRKTRGEPARFFPDNPMFPA